MQRTAALSLSLFALALGGCKKDHDPAPLPPLLIQLSASALNITSVEGGGNVIGQDVALTSTGTGTLNWTATTGATWLTVVPSSGTGAATLSVLANTSGLDPGVYVDAVTVDDPAAANTPQAITVTLTITGSPAPTAPVAGKLVVVSFTLDKTTPANPLPLVTFSRAVDVTTLTTSNVTLQDVTNAVAVPYTLTYASAPRQATLTPTTALSAGTQYALTLSTSVLDTTAAPLDQDDFTAGNQPYTTTFDTSVPMFMLKGYVPMSGVGDVWMDGNFVYVAGRSSGANGIYIVDATNISQPVVAKVLGSVGFVQDVKVANNILYATKEPGGVLLYNVSNPYAPTLITTINDSFVSDPHNVWISGSLLFVAETGTTGDIEVYDVSTPSAPVHRSTISNANTGALIHDMTMFNNRVYGAFLNGGFTIANVTTPSSPSTIVDHTYTGNFCHSAWPSASGNELYTTDEKAGGPLRIWDISTPTSPSQLTTYTANANLSIHNAQVDGNLVFISFYQAGVRVLDVSTPSAPVEIAFFDTFPGLDSGSGTFNGNWGVHKVGNRVAVSDLGYGLFLFRYTP